ncbi:hypothetical protein C2869_13290 [Saccharobesus litoralis]|uniref:DUF1585 domain-containing protein n=1 Tax=Saccharobesus litoralis TaxID=2172099 RepID=A0A2S0VT38_9ALTE|nr:hypothetical protein [Saccharobesus litoralis]AWB67353.1 hypothetical protein C2869_13290 [Saccharobesus litoralis]
MRMLIQYVKSCFSYFKLALGLLLVTTIPLSYAGSLEQAKQLHDRLAGVPADEARLNEMAALIDANQASAAADIAIDTPSFYSVTLKLFATPWTNEEQDIFRPLNDYSATVIGMVRDDIDFRQVLQGDIAYVGASSLDIPAYSTNNNNHYAALDEQSIDLKQHLEQVTQSSLNGFPPEATAGIMTTRQAARSFFYLGTNRAMLRFTLMNHLCTDLEPLKDNTRPSDRIRQDVSRSPGGDSRIFVNNCLACHSGMDPLAQAYAYYNFDFTNDRESGRIVYNADGSTDPDTGSRVQAKYHINATNFPYGFVTRNDDWINYWRQGINSKKLNWDETLPGKGAGAKSLGQELANSEAFAQCQVKKVFKTVCLREPKSTNDLAQVATSVASFKSHSYRLKNVFSELGVYCMGE